MINEESHSGNPLENLSFSKHALVFAILLVLLVIFRYFIRTIFSKLRQIVGQARPVNQGLNQVVINAMKTAPNSKGSPSPNEQQYESKIRDYLLDKNAEPNILFQKILQLDPPTSTPHFNNLISLCTKYKQFETAHFIFLELKSANSKAKPDVVSYNIYINGIVDAESNGSPLKPGYILAIFQEMESKGIVPNHITYNTVMKLYVEKGDLESAWQYFDEMMEKKIKPDAATFTTLVKGIKNDESSENRLKQLLSLAFIYIEDGNNKLDEVMFNTLIEVCLKFKMDGVAEHIIKLMQKTVVKPTAITYGNFIKHYGKIGDHEKAVEYYERIEKEGLVATEITYGNIIDVSVNCKRQDKAEEIFIQMKQKNVQPNNVIISSLIKGYTKARCFSKAYDLFRDISNKYNVEPNIISINAILDCCVQCNMIEKMGNIFEELVRNSESNRSSPQPDLITYSTLIKGLNKNGDMNKVMEVYNVMKIKKLQLDEVLFNSILDGFAKSKSCLNRLEQVAVLLNDMDYLKIKKSNVTYSILIKIFSQERKFDQAIRIHDEMIANNILPGTIVYTCLMQTCIKCKRIDKAIEFYEEIKCYKLELDVVAFQTIISGCIYNGKLEKAMMIVLDAHDIEVFVEKDIYNNLLKNMLNAIHGHRQRPIDFSLYERVYNSIRSNKIFGTSSLLESLYNSLYTNQRVDNRKYMQRSKY